MVKPFKLLHGYTYSDEYTVEPPFGISRRHWNMLPQDLRDGQRLNVLLYIEGFEAARIHMNINPHQDIENREMWNRGYLRYINRVEWNYNNVNPNPPIDERYPEFYNTDEYVFFDVTEVMPDPDSNQPYKFMLFRHIEEGNTVEGQRIYPGHPMYNFPDII